MSISTANRRHFGVGPHSVRFHLCSFRTYGCQKCLARMASRCSHRCSRAGTVSAATVVHRHADPRLSAAFRRVLVDLDGGPSLPDLVIHGAEAVANVVELARLPGDTDEDRLAVRFRLARKES